MFCLNYPGHFYYPLYACYAFTGSLSTPKKYHPDTPDPFKSIFFQYSLNRKQSQTTVSSGSAIITSCNDIINREYRFPVSFMHIYTIYYSALTAQRIFVDLALGLRAHSSADGLMTSLLTSL